MEESTEQPESDAPAFPSGEYDTVAKNVVRGNPDDFIRYCHRVLAIQSSSQQVLT